jgi:translation initiation factor 3 subunit A
LYTEGFRTVEDIYNILQISHARRKINPQAPPPKAKLMAAYYEKLTTLFWVSENYLFHAFAWYKYYTLCREYNRSMSEEMKEMQASAVLLATLCIPSHAQKLSNQQQQHGITSTFEDDIYKKNNARMATLLGFHTRHPTREALLTEIRSKNVMDSVPSYLKELYILLEENKDPLIMVKQAKPLLERLAKEVDSTNVTENEDFDDNTLGRYVKPLTSILLHKLLLNLSAAYHTVSIDNLKELTQDLGVSFDQVEKAIVLFTQTKSVSVRIDHRAGCLRFAEPELESEATRAQLTTLAKKLEALTAILQPPSPEVEANTRAALFNDIRTNLVTENAAILERKDEIEKRKEEVERLAQEKVREAERLKAEEDAARKIREEKRRQLEQRQREKEKQRRIQLEMEIAEKKKYLIAMGHNVDTMTEDEIANFDVEALQREHEEKSNKKREDAERKQREAAKRLDYLVRAVRIEEMPIIKKKYEEKIKVDRERYKAEVVEKVKLAREQWESDVKEKAQLQEHSVFEYISEFQELAMAGRKKIHKELCKAEDERAELEAEKGKLMRARKRKDDEAKRLVAEEAKRKAEAEAQRLAEEKERREEEKRKKEAEDEKRRQAELERMQEERDRKENERAPPPASRKLDAAEKGASNTNDKYVPPSRRAKEGGEAGGGGSRFGDVRSSDRFDRGGGYGGGRYEGRQQGGERVSRDDRGGFDDRRGGDRRFGGDRDRGGDRGSFRGRDDRDRGGSFGRRDDRREDERRGGGSNDRKW